MIRNFPAMFALIRLIMMMINWTNQLMPVNDTDIKTKDAEHIWMFCPYVMSNKQKRKSRKMNFFFFFHEAEFNIEMLGENI